ncbi:MAG: GntR family transcriptional regulator [Desulfobulbaceae bacterium]|nr:MAG: GntR family transcriptional regulator [Desulfobulbaceae bacterium]
MPMTNKLSRVNDAYSRIKEEIRTNRMPPGFQATEPEIALRLGMSRTPVREALIRLESEGLVELIPRRGARVLPINVNDMKEIYDILTSLEPDVAANVAAKKPTLAEMRPLEKAAKDMERALAREDLDAWADADDRFHLYMLDLNGNRRLREIVLALKFQVCRSRIVTLRLRDKPEKSNKEHREILDHIRKGDAEAARKAFRAHRQRAAEELIKLLKKFRITNL